MNSLEITNILKADRFTAGIFQGVYPSDRLPNVVKYPSAYIINTDPHSKPGTHWVHVHFVNSTFGFYFDSFGRPPEIAGIVNFLKRNVKHCYYTSISLQHELSTVCGHYCCVVMGLTARKCSFSSILSTLNCGNSLLNDKNVYSIFNSMFPRQSELKFKSICSYNQTCCARVGVM